MFNFPASFCRCMRLRRPRPTSPRQKYMVVLAATEFSLSRTQLAWQDIIQPLGPSPHRCANSLGVASTKGKLNCLFYHMCLYAFITVCVRVRKEMQPYYSTKNMKGITISLRNQSLDMRRLYSCFLQLCFHLKHREVNTSSTLYYIYLFIFK